MPDLDFETKIILFHKTVLVSLIPNNQRKQSNIIFEEVGISQ